VNAGWWAQLWDALGAAPAGRCAAYTPTLLRVERINDLLIAAAYYAYPLRVALARVRLLPTLSLWLRVLTLAFIVLCGSTHAFKVATGYYPQLLTLANVDGAATAMVSWGAYFALEGALRASKTAGTLPIRSQSDAATEFFRTYAALAVVAVAAAGAGAWGYNSLTGYVALAEVRRREMLATSAFEQMMSALRAAESNQRGFLLTGDPRDADAYSGSVRTVMQRQAQVKQLWPHAGAESLDPLIAAKMAEMDETLRLAKAGQRQAALDLVATGKGKSLMNETRRKASQVAAEAYKANLTHEATLTRSANVALVVMPLVGATAPFLVLGALLASVTQFRARARAEAQAAADVARVRAEAEAAAAVAHARAEAKAAAQVARVEAERNAAVEQSEYNAYMLNALSHDVRNPLNEIGTQAAFAVTLARKVPVDPRAIQAALAEIQTVTTSTADILNGFLEIARAERGHVAVAAFPARTVLQDVAQHVRKHAERKRLALEVDCPSGLTIRSDRPKLKRVLLNLAQNAVKFTEHGSVTLSAAAMPDGFRLAVRDTGPGLDPNFGSGLFADFRQGNNPERDPKKGFGLGLSIARRLAEQLGGRIEVESTVGAGSTFTVFVPELPRDQSIRDN
jgi:signal transduction histidine kinase